MTIIDFLADFPSPTRLPADPWFVAQGPYDCVRVIRHTYDCFEVEAFGLYGQRFRRRMFCYGSRAHRRAWAMEQARQWAKSFSLWLDETIYS